MDEMIPGELGPTSLDFDWVLRMECIPNMS